MRGLSVAIAETGNRRPHVLDSDAKEQSSCFDRPAAIQIEIESLAVHVANLAHFIIDEIGAQSLRIVATFLPQLRRSDALRAKESVDAACLPVARVA